MKISEKKKEKICEQILYYLFIESPKAIYTSYIAKEIARDEEFIKKIMIELKEKKLVNEIKKNKDGYDYIRRSRWKLSDSVYELYKSRQLK